MRRALFLSGFVFVLLVAIFYRKYVGAVSRLSSKNTNEEVLSPLILSYCGALLVGIMLAYLMENKVKFSTRIGYLMAMGLSAIPFLLGASRGSLVAVIMPFFFIMFTKKRKPGANLKIIVVIVVLLGLLFFLADKLGSGLVERLMDMNKDVSQSNTTAERSTIWKQALTQFINNPILGDKFQIEGFNNYPHNIIVEALQTTGVVGFVPFALLIIQGLKSSIRIFKRIPKHSWVAVIFIQSLAQNLFSGAIYDAGWFWLSLALVICVSSSIEEFIEKKPPAPAPAPIALQEQLLI